MSVTARKNEVAIAHAQVFITAFRALNSDIRQEIISELLNDEDLRDDIESALLWEDRKSEPSRSFREYLTEYEATL